MRKGENIVRDQLIISELASHRVIIPLYIPEETGYYEKAYQVFELCLFSLLKTTHKNIKISVVSNNSCPTVNAKLLSLSESGKINELIIVNEAIGKINSILKSLRHTKERFVTITDADVLFLNHWEDEVLKVFENFPNAGMVSPVPMYRTQLRLTSNIWMKYLLSNKLKFRPVANPEALEKFAKSVGWPNLHDKMKDVYLTLKGKNNSIAVVGNSHFVGTYKREVFDNLPKGDSEYVLGGNSEFKYLDEPVLKSGGYRLATHENYAYHLGNVTEDWAVTEYNNLQQNTLEHINVTSIKILKKQVLNYYIAESFFKKIFYSKKVKQLAYKLKGLTEKQIHNFIDSKFY